MFTDEELGDLSARVDAGEAMEFASLWEEVVQGEQAEPDPAFARLADEELVEGFRVASSEINAAMCRWLLMLAEILRRRAWAVGGVRTPAEWLSYVVSMAPSTARERIRVALRLRHFPQTTARFGRGEISYSKVRAITRTGRPELEETLLRYADAATGSQLERILRGFRTMRRHEQAGVVDAFELRDAELRYRDEHTVEIRVRLPLLEGETLWAQWRHAADQLYRELKQARDPEDPDARLPRRRQLVADVAMQTGDLLGEETPDDTSGVDRHTLVLHADAEALTAPDDGGDRPVAVRASAEARQPAMSARALRRLACDARLAVVAHDADGNVVSASGTTRKIPARLRRMLHARDRSCRFPSCGARRGLEGHHIVFWLDDGPTELSNLVLLCRHHHQFVHTHGWIIHHDGHGRFGFQPPNGDIRPAVHPLPTADPLRAFSYEHWNELEFEPSGVTSGWNGQRPDISYAVGGLLDRLADLHRIHDPHDPHDPHHTAIAA